MTAADGKREGGFRRYIPNAVAAIRGADSNIHFGVWYEKYEVRAEKLWSRSITSRALCPRFTPPPETVLEGTKIQKTNYSQPFSILRSQTLSESPQKEL